MDYSEMSDAEIGRRVAAACKLEGGANYNGKTLIVKNGVWTSFDPCNNPEDAWPIISENKISLNWAEVEKSWCAHVGGVMTDGCWCWDYAPDHHQDNINPLRAAMIVFLMVHESKP